MEYCLYKIVDRPYCCWEENLKERNLNFINSIDSSFFRYNVELHQKYFETENKQNSAFAIRQTFHHVLETMFTLICASLQAPQCVYGWIHKATIGDVRKIIKSINSKEEVFNVINLSDVTWEKYIEKIFFVENNPTDGIEEISKAFSNFIKSISHDFLDDYNIKEYNSFKHGFRLKKGGFKFAFGPEKEPGKPAKTEDMRILSDSEFGSSFYAIEEIKDFTSKQFPHYQSNQYMLNWKPQNLVYSVISSSYFIENLLAFLRMRNGVEKVDFKCPEDLEYLKFPWKNIEGTMSMNFDFNITKEMIIKFTKRDIINRLNKIWKKNA